MVCSCTVKQILWSNVRPCKADVYENCGMRQIRLQQYLVHCDEYSFKHGYMSTYIMSVLLLIDFHKLRSPINHSHSYLYYFGVSEGVKKFW